MSKIEEACKKLEEFARYEGSEVGEKWSCLVSMWNHRDYFSDKFGKALEKEIINDAKYIEENLVLVPREETRPQKWMEIMHKDDVIEQEDE